MKALTIIGLVLVVLAALAAVVLTFFPLGADSVARAALGGRPAATYEEAMAAFAAVEASEAEMNLDQRCRSVLLTHGERTARVVVFLHGLTNCPKQGDVLAAQLYALGYNVYLPRIPGHGEADRLTLALSGLTAEDLAASAGAALDLATGLGEEITVAGISAGGSMTAWLAQTRPEVDRAIVIAPYLGPVFVPPYLLRPATTLARLAPNQMRWWNPDDPLGETAMDYAYPRYSTRAVGEVMRFGLIVADLARERPPAATEIAAMINEADEAASNPLTLAIVESWRRHGRDVEVETIPASLGLPHDVIDPRQPAEDIALVYPILIGMIGGADGSAR
ncbi:MAG: alpha/beta hydrolase [Bauldia sp.]|nr:alpha/beta hydrolase [Bauldia sp.]